MDLFYSLSFSLPPSYIHIIHIMKKKPVKIFIHKTADKKTMQKKKKEKRLQLCPLLFMYLCFVPGTKLVVISCFGFLSILCVRKIFALLLLSLFSIHLPLRSSYFEWVGLLFCVCVLEFVQVHGVRNYWYDKEQWMMENRRRNDRILNREWYKSKSGSKDEIR